MSAVNSLHIEYSECDGIKGYILTYPDGARLFQHTLSEALTVLATYITGVDQLVLIL